jgi:hypothetical protein
LPKSKVLSVYGELESVRHGLDAVAELLRASALLHGPTSRSLCGAEALTVLLRERVALLLRATADDLDPAILTHAGNDGSQHRRTDDPDLLLHGWDDAKAVKKAQMTLRRVGHEQHHEKGRKPQ